MLIDTGSGAVLDHLDEAGVNRVGWVLHTHHHRDQCWGDERLIEHGSRIAVPEYERHLFEQAELFWQSWRVWDNYDDRNNFLTIGHNIPVESTLDDYEMFRWGDSQFFVLPAKGHTSGSIALVAQIDGRLVVFTGDLIAQGGVLYQLHAMEYAYGDMVGGLFTLQSIQALRDLLQGEIVAGRSFEIGDGTVLLPSHGQPIEKPIDDINLLESRLVDLASLGRNLRFGGRESILEPLYLPEPEFVPLSPHLLWGGNWTCSFFYVLLSESGKAMFVDYGHSFQPHMHTFADHHGMERMRFIEHHLKELRNRWNIKSLDLVVPTHIHDDHTCGIPHLQRHYDTKCYALDVVAQVLTDPARWASTPCTFHKPIHIERTLADAEQFQWEEYSFDIYHAPGQTEYHSILTAEIDNRRVAFTGDNYLVTEVLRSGQAAQTAMQTTVLRNSFQLEMHRKCIDVMRCIEPELICPGHWQTFDFNKAALDEYADFIQRKEQVFRQSGRPTGRPLYRLVLGAIAAVHFRAPNQASRSNLRYCCGTTSSGKQRTKPGCCRPRGWQSEEHYISLTLEARTRGEIKIQATAPPQADRTRRLVTADIRIDGKSQGPVAEALVTVG